MSDTPFTWNGSDLRTMGEVMDAVVAIAKAGDTSRAQAFIDAYVASGTPLDVVRENLGYAAGYYGRESFEAIQRVFDVSHPQFGRHWPTPLEAFAAGREAK